MKELSLHIMDLAQNSVTAGATRIDFIVEENTERDTLSVTIKDNGCGMDESFLKNVTSPFTTTRTTRKVGLGIPLFKEVAELTGGHFNISSQKGVGTQLEAVFGLSSIDRVPMGNLAETILLLVTSNPATDITLTVRVDQKEFYFSTIEIRSVLGEDVPLDMPDVIAWMKDNLTEGIQSLNGGM